jgi:hypothetical protein
LNPVEIINKNEYFFTIFNNVFLMEIPLKPAGDSAEESTLLPTEYCREIK